MKEVVLQEQRTLDQVIISSIKTFKNGCNFRLVKETDGLYYLEYGCYGILVNLITGDEKLLYKWFSSQNKEIVLLSGIVGRDTINHLLKSEPCSLCGGTRFKMDGCRGMCIDESQN